MRARPAVLAAVALAVSVVPAAVPSGPALAVDPPAGTATAAVTDSSPQGEARRKLAAAQAALVPARAELARATSALAEAEERQRAVAAALAEAQAEGERAEAAVATARAALQTAQDAAALMVREVYVQGIDGTARQLSVALGAGDARDVAAAVTLTRAIGRNQVQQIRHLGARRADLAAREADLASARSALERRRADAAAVVDRERTLLDRASRTSARVSALVAARTAAVTLAEATKRQDSGRYAELHGEELSLLRRLAELGDAAVPALSPGGFQPPTQGRGSSPFGMRVHPISGVHKLHTGTDIAAPCGSPIVAAQNGVVIVAEYNRGYGYRTVVDHGTYGGHRFVSTYNHQEGLSVSAGQVLSRGEKLGTVGTTGYSTGCHLHFEMLVDGRFVDPVPYLR